MTFLRDDLQTWKSQWDRHSAGQTGPCLRPSQSGEFWEELRSCDREVLSEKDLRLVPPAFPTPYSPLRIFLFGILKTNSPHIGKRILRAFFPDTIALFLSRRQRDVTSIQ
jgi:hypothetical protein